MQAQQKTYQSGSPTETALLPCSLYSLTALLVGRPSLVGYAAEDSNAALDGLQKFYRYAMQQYVRSIILCDK